MHGQHGMGYSCVASHQSDAASIFRTSSVGSVRPTSPFYLQREGEHCLEIGAAEGSCHLSKLDHAFDKISAPLIADARSAFCALRRLEKSTIFDYHPLYIRIAMGAKQKEAKPVASKSVPAAKTENGVTDTVTIANGQKVIFVAPLHPYALFSGCHTHHCSVGREAYRLCGLDFCTLCAQIPVAIPPNLDPAVAKQVIEYLKANPEAAQQSYEQAHRMLQTPGMAQIMVEAKVRAIFTSKIPNSTPCGSCEPKREHQ